MTSHIPALQTEKFGSAYLPSVPNGAVLARYKAGTEGSNPSPSTGESANSRSLLRRMVGLRPASCHTCKAFKSAGSAAALRRPVGAARRLRQTVLGRHEAPARNRPRPAAPAGRYRTIAHPRSCPRRVRPRRPGHSDRYTNRNRPKTVLLTWRNVVV